MLLKLGSTGPEVVDLVARLRQLGYLKDLTCWDTFTDSVKTAVIAFQRDNKLKPDGLVGDVTKNALSASRDLTAVYEKEVADILNVDPKLIRAFSKVESSGGGFLPDGRIKVLFEKHRFKKQLIAQGMDLLAKLLEKEVPDLCGPASKTYLGGSHENERLALAMRYHKRAAMESASYGKFQLMGFRYDMCGFDHVEDFVAYLERGELEQYLALANFVKAQPDLLQAMRKLDFLQMALIYNGPAQKGYDLLIRKAYEELR